MEKFRIVSFLFLMMLALTSGAQINIFHIDNNTAPPTKEGIFYSLPRTVVKIEVKIDRIENYKGPYADFALRFLGLKNVVTANSIDYKISDITITTYPEPDPDQYYFIELDDKISKGDNSGLFSLNDAGLFLGTIPDEKASDGDLTTPQIQGQPLLESEKDAFGELFKYSADVSVFEKVDTIIRKINMDTMMVERQYYKRTMIEKSPEQKAKEAADFIAKIKDSRFQLISGFQEVNYNRETLEYMDTQLKIMEKEYMKLFTGISIHKPMTFEYKYIPMGTQINAEIPIFKFSRSLGVIDLDGSGGKVVTIKIQRVGNTNTVAAYLKKAVKEPKTHGFSYRIPELARVTVRLDENAQKETQCLISQLGVITYLPVNKWKVQYYQETGGIKGIELH
ncbi:MAG: DUF4831 family protein [Bacteroidota bacterium]